MKAVNEESEKLLARYFNSGLSFPKESDVIENIEEIYKNIFGHNATFVSDGINSSRRATRFRAIE